MQCNVDNREVDSTDDAEDAGTCEGYVRAAVDTFFLGNPALRERYGKRCNWNKMTTLLIDKVRALPVEGGLDLVTPAAKWLHSEIEKTCGEAA